MLNKVTFQTVDSFRIAIDAIWKSRAQQVWMQEVMEADDCCSQGFRQKGKSHGLAFLGSAYVAKGGTPIIAAPTRTQASQLIFERIRRMSNQYFTEWVDERVKKHSDTTTYVSWDQSGSLRALSASHISIHKPEGYTGNLLIIDEGHRVPMSMLGIFLPMLDDAVIEGTAKVVINGIGGHKTSLIEGMKKKGFTAVQMPASRALEIDPSLKPLFDQRRSELSDWEWRQNYECLPVIEGSRHIYPDGIPSEIDESRLTAQPRDHIGIDVAREVNRDMTVAKAVRRWGTGSNAIKIEIDTFEIGGLPFEVQAERIFEWVVARKLAWRPDRVCVELNGLGRGLSDAINLKWSELTQRHIEVNGIWTNEKTKEQFWHNTTVDMREGRFYVMSQSARDDYESLMLSVRENDGKIEFEHSDTWMALHACYHTFGQVESI